jgi:hypothetical protein
VGADRSIHSEDLQFDAAEICERGGRDQHRDQQCRCRRKDAIH